MQQQDTQNISLLRDKVLNFIKINGPILPVQVSKHINSDLILAGAILSELSSKNLILISHAKVGGSPLYYAKEQQPKLPNLLYNHLNSREKEAYNLINKDKVLKDINLEPAHRIAIRNLKDFAIPLNVIQDEKTELFWKYYLTNEEEAKNIIQDLLKPKEEIKPIEQIQEQKEPEKLLKKIIKEKPKQKDNFYEIIKDYLTKNKIRILEENIIRKHTEFEFIVKLPSSVGHLRYYVKAKSKNTINDADVSLAYSESQQKKLPCLFIIKGKPTKKAIGLAQKLSQITIKQI